MKKLLIILSAAATLLLTGCDKDNPVDGEGRIVAVSKTDKVSSLTIPYVTRDMELRYVIFDEHEYVVLTGFRQAGITHSPRCKCLKNLTQKDL